MLVKTAKDPEVNEWRKKNRQVVFGQLQKLSDKAYRKSKSEKSRENVLNNVLVFCSWRKETPLELLEGIRTAKTNVYTLLDDYVDWLSKSGLSPNSIKDYIASSVKFLRTYDVEINRDLLRDKVSLPRTYSVTRDRIPTPEELKRLLLHTNIRGKAVLTALASSGMRSGELLSLRVKDIDFSKRPATVSLRAEITKDRLERICFMSDEAAAFLKEYLGERGKNPDAYVFQGRHQGVDNEGKVKFVRGEWENKPMSYWNLDVIVSSTLRAAGLLQKDEHGRDIIHVHSFRKFFFTRMLGVLGREMTEALMGHRQFLDSAYRRYTQEDLGQAYLRAMSAVTALLPQTVEVMDPKRLEELKSEISEKYEGEIDSLKRVMVLLLDKLQSGQVSSTEVQAIVSGLTSDTEPHLGSPSSAPSGEKGEKSAGPQPRQAAQKVFDTSDVPGALESGDWRFVSTLSDQSAVLERLS